MNTEEKIALITQKLPAATAAAGPENTVVVTLVKADLLPFAAFLKGILGYDYLRFMTCIDRADRLELQYHLYSYGDKSSMILKTACERIKGVVPSLAGVWRAADWHEREAFDMFGVTFEGHPDLRRILLEDGFEGHPLLKDFTHKNLVPLPKT